jgi:hypothetical protein
LIFRGVDTPSAVVTMAELLLGLVSSCCLLWWARLLPAKFRRSVYILGHQVVRTSCMMKYTMFLVCRALAGYALSFLTAAGACIVTSTTTSLTTALLTDALAVVEYIMFQTSLNVESDWCGTSMPESTGQRASAAFHIITVVLLSAAFTMVVIASGKAHIAWWHVVRGRAHTPEAASLLAYRERLDVYAAWCKACLQDEYPYYPSELLRDVRRRRWSNRATALAMTAWKTAFFIPHRLRLHVNTVPWICGLGMGLAVSLMPGSGLSNA